MYGHSEDTAATAKDRYNLELKAWSADDHSKYQNWPWEAAL
jgi:hypothetical protein